MDILNQIQYVQANSYVVIFAAKLPIHVTISEYKLRVDLNNLANLA